MPDVAACSPDHAAPPPGLALIEPPAYIYDLASVRKAYHLLRRALPRPSSILYSLKANPHPQLVRALARLGCGAEICSVGELAVALSGGVVPSRIFYTGPGKRDVDVAAALQAGVRWYSVDSPVGLRQIDAAARARGVVARCLLRVNDGLQVPGQRLAMTGMASQFGADVDWVLSEPAAFTPAANGSAGATLAGFHVYQGSNVDTEDALAAQFAAAITTSRRLADALSIQPQTINLGGGFGAPFATAGSLPLFPALADRIAALLQRAFPDWRAGRPKVVFESGRYLVGCCGQLITRVADVKRSHGQPVVVLESGIHHLGGMSGLRRVPPIVPDLISAEPADGKPQRGAIIAGPLCTTLDTWARSADVPPLRPGDVVRVPNVGAYGLSASLLAFLGHPAPREVVVDGAVIVDVSRLELIRRALRPGDVAAEGHDAG